MSLTAPSLGSTRASEGVQVPPDAADLPVPLLETLPERQLPATVSGQHGACLTGAGDPQWSTQLAGWGVS